MIRYSCKMNYQDKGDRAKKKQKQKDVKTACQESECTITPICIHTPRPHHPPRARAPGIMCDLLWSDPEADLDGWAESDRGVSYSDDGGKEPAGRGRRCCSFPGHAGRSSFRRAPLTPHRRRL